MSTIQWARVEYQPDLKDAPSAPIPLGVLLVYTSEAVLAVVAMGREPRPGSRPRELGAAGTLGMSQLEGWVMAMAREAQLESGDPFAPVLSRWQWNLYIRDPELVQRELPIKGDFRGELLSLAKELYERHVNEPFALGKQLDEPKIRRPARETPWVPHEVNSLALAP